MPMRSKKTCAVGGCAQAASGRWCPAHMKTKAVARPYDAFRGSSAERGYDGDWRKLRLLALERDHHLCQHCLKLDLLTPAKDVDHIVAISDGGERLDLDNLQSLCKSCHSKKTNQENGAFGRPTKLVNR